MVVMPSARAARVRPSWSRAASRSISNDHSYGYDHVATRSWRSTAGPVAVEHRVVVDELGADDVAAGDGVAEERRRGERLVVGERLLGQASPDGGVVDEHARQRVAERARIGGHQEWRQVLASTSAVVVEQLGLRLVGLGAVLLGEHAEEPIAVHPEQHADPGGATGDRRRNHPAGGIQVTQHPSDVIAPFSQISFECSTPSECWTTGRRTRSTRMEREDGSVPDLTQCTATELLDLYRSRDGVAGRGHPRRARPDRGRPARDQRLLPRRRRRGARLRRRRAKRGGCVAIRSARSTVCRRRSRTSS